MIPKLMRQSHEKYVHNCWCQNGWHQRCKKNKSISRVLWTIMQRQTNEWQKQVVIHFGVGRQGKPDDEMCLSHIEQAPSMCHKGTIFGRTWPNKSHLPVQNVLETVQNFQCGALWNFLARDKKLEEAWRLKCVDSSDVYTCVWLWLACWPVVNCVTCGPIIIIIIITWLHFQFIKV